MFMLSDFFYLHGNLQGQWGLMLALIDVLMLSDPVQL